MEILELVEILKSQLRNSQADDKYFVLESASVCIKFTVGTEGSSLGRIKFWVAEVEVGGGASHERVHEMTLNLKPLKKITLGAESSNPSGMIPAPKA